MNNIKTVLFAVAGLSIAVVASLFTASLVLAFAGIATVLLAARAVSVRLQPEPVRVYARDDRNSRMGRRQGHDHRHVIAASRRNTSRLQLFTPVRQIFLQIFQRPFYMRASQARRLN
jgi:hypothetical protein